MSQVETEKLSDLLELLFATKNAFYQVVGWW